MYILIFHEINKGSPMLTRVRKIRKIQHITAIVSFKSRI